LRGALLAIGLAFSGMALCAWASPQRGRLPEKSAGFRLSTRRLAFAPCLEPAVGGLSKHFLERGVESAERGVYVGPEGGQVEVLLLTFFDCKKAKEYYLFWRALEVLAGPVKDVRVPGAEVCTSSVNSGEWALLSGRSLILIRPMGVEIPPKFVERLAGALKGPQAFEIRLPLRERGGRCFIALRDLAEAIKAPLTYDAKRGEALLKIGVLVLAFKPGRGRVMLGEAALSLPSPPVLVDGRICLPPEAVEALTGAKVSVDKRRKVATLLFGAMSPSPSRGAPPGGECKGQGYTAPKGASEEAGDRVP